MFDELVSICVHCVCDELPRDLEQILARNNFWIIQYRLRDLFRLKLLQPVKPASGVPQTGFTVCVFLVDLLEML